MRIQSTKGIRYILAIVDDFSRFTWNMFLRSKDEAARTLIRFVNGIDLKLNYKIASDKLDHGTDFKNAQN